MRSWTLGRVGVERRRLRKRLPSQLFHITPKMYCLQAVATVKCKIPDFSYRFRKIKHAANTSAVAKTGGAYGG